jgi:predicted SnoaL-like aldol condensation-catalyzing enzyme
LSLEANKALVRRFIEEVQSQHKIMAVDEIMDPNMIEHFGPPSSLNSVEAFKKFFAGFIAAFPDVKAVIHSQVAEGDKVVTHKTFHIELIDIFRISGGKLMEHWAVVDWMSVMQQLGVLPSPSPQK